MLNLSTNAKKIIKKIIPTPLFIILRSFYKSNNKISTGYTIIKNPNLNELKNKYNSAWQDKTIPKKQLALVNDQLQNFQNVSPVKAIIELIKKINSDGKTLLDIGCSSGYYSEILEKSGFNIKYEGCDYSSEFIALAKKQYPDLDFKVCDATSLDYTDNQFDIVISGCCILHIIDYEKAIKETARIAKDYVIFHRTPVITKNKTTYTLKSGYNVKMFEILFNEEELFKLFISNNLKIEHTNVHHEFSIEGLNEPIKMKSYLCKKNQTRQ